MQFVVIVWTVFSGLLSGQESKIKAPEPCGAIPTERQVRWLRMEWYAFVHFGINTFTDREWGYGNEDPKLFNPADFNAEATVRAFKDAGMTAMIYTAKHHDGFCLWPTKATKYNVTLSPWRNGKGDVVKEFARACKKYGLKFGVYLSPWDRNCAEYGRPGYLKVYERQIRELLTQYGPIFEIWFDGANGGDGFYGGAKETRKISGEGYYNFPHIVKLIRSLQPNCIIWGAARNGDVQWGGSERGFVQYPCWNLINMDSPNEKWISLEADTTINHAGWFWHPGQASRVKSPEQLMQVYMDSVGRGANLILNVASDRSGNIDPADLAALKTLGQMRRTLLSKDYALHAKANASEVRGNSSKFAAANVTDGDMDSYWCPEDHTAKGCWVEVQLPDPVSFDVIRLREQIRLGQRVKAFRIEAWQQGNWRVIDDEGRSIGNQVMRKLSAPITTDRVRVVITDSRACPCLSEISLLRYPSAPIATAPQHSTLGIANALPREGWKSSAPGADKAWDGDDSTYWESNENSLVIDLGQLTEFSGFTYLPKQDGNVKGMTDHFRVEVSADGLSWKKAADGEFSNVRANPILQVIRFPRPLKARFFRFIGTSALEGDGASIAELNLVR